MLVVLSIALYVTIAVPAVTLTWWEGRTAGDGWHFWRLASIVLSILWPLALLFVASAVVYSRRHRAHESQTPGGDSSGSLDDS